MTQPPPSPSPGSDPVRPRSHTPPPYADRRLDDLRELKRTVAEEDRRASEFLDRVAILAGPAVILASFTFIKDVAPKPISAWHFVLVLAWLVLVAASGCGLLAQRAKREAAKAYDSLLDRKLREGDPILRVGDYDAVRPPNSRTRTWGDRALVALVFGVALLSVFAGGTLLSSTIQNSPPEAESPSTGTRQTPFTDSAVIRLLLSSCESTDCVIVYRARGSGPWGTRIPSMGDSEPTTDGPEDTKPNPPQTIEPAPRPPP